MCGSGVYDSGVSDSRVYRTISLLGALAILCFFAGTLSAQNPDYSLILTDDTVVGGTNAECTVFIDNENGESLSGFSFSICQDPTLVNAVDAAFGEDLQAMNDGDGPDFFGIGFFPEGIGCGTVFGLLGGVYLLPDSLNECVLMTYETFPTPPTTSELQFCDTVGSPPSAITLVLQSGGSVDDPILDHGLVTFIDGPSIVRGDVNGNGTINIADPIIMLAYMFQGGPGVCVAAMDVDGDNTVVIADALYLLFYINGLGPMPVAPFPSCGVIDPAPLPCDDFPACP